MSERVTAGIFGIRKLRTIMKPGRNDPCYCGSGKKYKHCHLKADLETEKAQPTAAALELPSRSITNKPSKLLDEPKEIDPETEQWNKLYEKFNQSAYAEQVAILRNAIEEKLLDGELAFEFFSHLYPEMAKQGDREEFAALVTLLQTKQPDVYAKENHWFWSWEVTNALALQDEEALQQAVDQLIRNGGQDFDQFYPVYNCLLYHDRRANLLNALSKHMPQIESGKYFDDVEDELKRKFVDLQILDYLETHAANELLDEQNFEGLYTTLVPYTVDILHEGLASFLSLAGGLSNKAWSMSDFEFAMQTKRSGWFADDDDDDEEESEDPAVVHLRDLGNEFLYYARHLENIALTKADMAREELMNYFLARQRGELIDDSPMLSSRRQVRSPKGRSKASDQGSHILLPDHKTLDRFLMRFYGFLANGTYEGAAFFELIPTWTRFLQAKGLVSIEEGQRSLRSMQDLSQSMMKIMEQYDSDPTLALNIGKWREQAGI